MDAMKILMYLSLSNTELPRSDFRVVALTTIVQVMFYQLVIVGTLRSLILVCHVITLSQFLTNNEALEALLLELD